MISNRKVWVLFKDEIVEVSYWSGEKRITMIRFHNFDLANVSAFLFLQTGVIKASEKFLQSIGEKS